MKIHLATFSIPTKPLRGNCCKTRSNRDQHQHRRLWALRKITRLPNTSELWDECEKTFKDPQRPIPVPAGYEKLTSRLECHISANTAPVQEATICRAQGAPTMDDSVCMAPMWEVCVTEIVVPWPLRIKKEFFCLCIHSKLYSLLHLNTSLVLNCLLWKWLKLAKGLELIFTYITISDHFKLYYHFSMEACLLFSLMDECR